MANATNNMNQLANGKGGIQINIPVKGATRIYDGIMIAQLTSTGMAVPGSTASSGACVGVATHEVNNTSGADGDARLVVEVEALFRFANASANPFSVATPIGSPAYMSDDHTVNSTDVGATLKKCGYFYGMEPDGLVRVFVTPR